ncbi:heterokaryon incompatibility protein-domain-containing protein [Bisporella sp. PMI_857]|nr:heterokaryon incompatibility protein-domain-containing protein [Bisporella sp. PMI_857]
MEAYNYRPLDVSRCQFRLLKVDRSLTATSMVQCHLENFDLNNAPRYTALSYRWTYSEPADARPKLEAMEEEQSPLIVDGKLLHVSENLTDFLEAFHGDARNKPSWLWIDQISINQKNMVERNQQVGLMSGIYGRCLSLIIWLGKASAPAAQLFSKHGSVELLQNSYFTRVWIVQEILLAEDIEVLGGTTWINWRSFAVVPLTVDAGIPLATCSLLDRAQSYLRGSTGLAELLIDFGMNQCTDPRDRVYGLLGLARKEQRLEVDYSKTLWEVFLDTMLILCNARYDDHFNCVLALSGLAISFSMADCPQHLDPAELAKPFHLSALLLEMRHVAAGGAYNNREIPPGPKKMAAIGIHDGQWWFEFLDEEGNKMRIDAEAQKRVPSELANKLGWFNKYRKCTS